MSHRCNDIINENVKLKLENTKLKEEVAKLTKNRPPKASFATIERLLK